MFRLCQHKHEMTKHIQKMKYSTKLPYTFWNKKAGPMFLKGKSSMTYGHQYKCRIVMSRQYWSGILLSNINVLINRNWINKYTNTKNLGENERGMWKPLKH